MPFAGGISMSLEQALLLALMLLVILPGVTTLPVIVAIMKSRSEFQENQALGRERRARQGRGKKSS